MCNDIEIRHIKAAFPASFKKLCRAVLVTNSELKWHVASQLSLAPRSGTWVLNTETKVRSLRFALLVRSFEQRSLQLLSGLGPPFGLVNPVAQCFATRMNGHPINPPRILPHVDSYQLDAHSLVTPRISFIYYPVVKRCSGGVFVVHSTLAEGKSAVNAITPAEGDLIILPGKIPHSVSPLLEGERISLVLNMYERHELTNLAITAAVGEVGQLS